MINAIVVDDEWAAGNLLSIQLSSSEKVEVLKTIQNPYEALVFIKCNKVDAVFLDIEMSEMNGIELAEHISTLEYPPEIIFVTAYSKYAIEAFRVDALEYVVKPVYEKDLNRAIEKLNKSIANKRIINQAQYLNKDNMLFLPSHKMLNFQTSKSEELYIYLLLRNNSPVSKWRIIEDLWPEMSVENGESRLRTNVYRVNQAFSQAGMKQRVKATKGSYQITQNGGSQYTGFFPKNTPPNIDKDNFLDYIKVYNPLSLLEDKDYLWLVDTRQKYEHMYYEWAMGILKKFEMGDHFILSVLRYLLEYFPVNDSLILQLMKHIKEVEGKTALVNFYKNLLENWDKLHGFAMDEKVKKEYISLLKSL